MKRLIKATLFCPAVIGTIMGGTFGFMLIGFATINKKLSEKDELIRWRTHHAAVLEDVINDIYENDREYFDKNIATSEHFDSLRSLYKDEFKRDPKTITWDDMYNY